MDTHARATGRNASASRTKRTRHDRRQGFLLRFVTHTYDHTKCMDQWSYGPFPILLKRTPARREGPNETRSSCGAASSSCS